ncbi:hypothetical protein JCM8097_006257 [Rhodosporidiobolus ruineniae]
MHFPVFLLSTAALLGGLTSAVPLPGATIVAGAAASASASASSSCVCSNEVSVAAGAAAGAGVKVTNAEPMKVKQGTNRRCPEGWKPSVVHVNLCIEIGGDDHKKEQKHAASNKNAKTSSAPHRSSTSTHAAKKTSTSARRVASATPTAARKKCPDGQTLGGALLDLCVDIDTSPLYLGGGIKIGSGPRSSSTLVTSTRARSTAWPTNSPSPTARKCPDGQETSGALLDLCVDIDADPLHLGAGIKIGSGPARATTTSSGAKGRVTTPTSAAQKSDLPPCGKNDPLALLDLCVQVGDLLGAKVKIGGSDDDEDDGSGTFNRGAGVKIAQHTSSASRSTTTSARPRQTASSPGKGKGNPLPACDGVNDPNAALNLCVKVGSSNGGKDPLVGVGAKVLGENGTKAKATVGGATVADVSLDNKGLKAEVPGVLSVDTTGENKDSSDGLLNLGVGGLLKAPVLAASPRSSSPTPAKTPSFQTYHQTAPVRSSSTTPHADHDTAAKPLVSADAAVKVTSGSSSNGAKQSCSPGEILHLGVCVKAAANVAGIVKASATAKLGL